MRLSCATGLASAIGQGAAGFGFLFLLGLSLAASAQEFPHRLPIVSPVGSDMPTEVPTPHPEPTLALSDLECMALKNSPAMVLAAARVDAARGQWQQVGLYPNPAAGYLATEIGDEQKAGQQGGYLSQQFVMGGKRRLDQAAAGQEVQRLQREFDAQRLRLVSDVRISFYETLIAQQRIDLANQLTRVGQEGLAVTELLLKGKEASKPDLLQARIESNSARILAENARNAYAAAWRRLAAVIGSPQMGPVQLAGQIDADLKSLNWDESVGHLLAASPELAAVDASIGRAEFALQRARREPIPNIDVMLSAQFDNATSDPIGGIQAGVPMPIFNRNQGGISKAEAEVIAARSNAQRLQLELTRRMASTFERYANARQQVDLYAKNILPDARASLDLMTASYRAGEASYLMLLTVQRTYFQANLAYLEALRELRESSVIIENMMLSDSLASRE